MVYNKEKICFLRKLFIIVVLLFVPLFTVIKNSSPVSALWTADYGVRFVPYENGQCSSSNTYTTGHTYNQWFYGCNIDTIVPITQNITADGDTIVFSGKLNLVKDITATLNDTRFHPFVQIGVRNVYFDSEPMIIKSEPSIQFWITDWTDVLSVNGSNIQVEYQTLTIQWSITAYSANINGSTGRVSMSLYAQNNNGHFDVSNGTKAAYYFENTNEPLVIYFVDTGSGSNNTIINQNTINIQQNDTIINQDKEYYGHEYEAESNISGQDTSDIDNATNDKTTSIIGTISSFVSAIGTVQTGSCQMTLPFPSFLGGDTTVNPCTGKEKAPTIVSIGSSMFLIGIFIPFAFVVLKMIYNEIRSFTNG